MSFTAIRSFPESFIGGELECHTGADGVERVIRQWYRFSNCLIFYSFIFGSHIVYIDPHNILNTIASALSESRQVGTSRMGSARV
jgi:hypothetical protein